MDIIKLENIAYNYPDGTQALKHISLSLEKGKKIVFLGPNGSGKTTLFLLLAGALEKSSGIYFFRDRVIKRKDLQNLHRSVGIVFQDPEVQLLASTVAGEISFGPVNIGWSSQKITESVEKAMLATGIDKLKERVPHLLSYGQKRAVTIASILAMEPEVIILDEPLTWLDSEHKKNVLTLLDHLSSLGKTLVISSHDADFAYEWADHIFILKAGRLLGAGNPEDVFSADNLIKEAFLDTPLLFEISRRLKLDKGLKSREELFKKLETLWV